MSKRRRIEHEFLVKSQKQLKDWSRYIEPGFQMNRYIDAKEYDLLPYRGTRDRGYYKWLYQSEKFNGIQTLMENSNEIK